MSWSVSLLGPLRGAGGFCFFWDACLTGVEVCIAAEVTKLLDTSHCLGPQLDATCDLIGTFTALDPLPLPLWRGVLLPLLPLCFVVPRLLPCSSCSCWVIPLTSLPRAGATELLKLSSGSRETNLQSWSEETDLQGCLGETDLQG